MTLSAIINATLAEAEAGILILDWDNNQGEEVWREVAAISDYTFWIWYFANKNLLGQLPLAAAFFLKYDIHKTYYIIMIRKIVNDEGINAITINSSHLR